MRHKKEQEKALIGGEGMVGDVHPAVRQPGMWHGAREKLQHWERVGLRPGAPACAQCMLCVGICHGMCMWLVRPALVCLCHASAFVCA